jgi:hypothetical protein
MVTNPFSLWSWSMFISLQWQYLPILRLTHFELDRILRVACITNNVTNIRQGGKDITFLYYKIECQFHGYFLIGKKLQQITTTCNRLLRNSPVLVFCGSSRKTKLVLSHVTSRKAKCNWRETLCKNFNPIAPIILKLLRFNFVRWALLNCGFGLFMIHGNQVVYCSKFE